MNAMARSTPVQRFNLAQNDKKQPPIQGLSERLSQLSFKEPLGAIRHPVGDICRGRSDRRPSHSDGATVTNRTPASRQRGNQCSSAVTVSWRSLPRALELPSWNRTMSPRDPLRRATRANLPRSFGKGWGFQSQDDIDHITTPQMPKRSSSDLSIRLRQPPGGRSHWGGSMRVAFPMASWQRPISSRMRARG